MGRKCLGNKVKIIREVKNISQNYVAINLGISQPAYSCIESGKTKIDDIKLSKIASILGVKAEAILNFTDHSILCREDPLYQITPLEKLESVYSQLIAEKDARIKLLEELVKK